MVPGSLSSFPLFPSKTDGLVHVSNVQSFDTFLLAEELGKAIEGTWKFRHDQHSLEMVRDFKPRHVASGEVRSHLVNGSSGVFVVIDLDVHGRFELKVGRDDTRLPVLLLKVVP